MAEVHCNDGQSSQPTPRDWTRHKDEIISLYRKKSLGDVQKIMMRKYNFKASKRMYDQRFKNWGFEKNIRRNRKDEMARKIATAAQTGQDTSSLGISHAEVRKVMRYVQSQSKKATRSPLPVLSIESPDRSPGSVSVKVEKASSSPSSARTSRYPSTVLSPWTPPDENTMVYASTGAEFDEDADEDIPLAPRTTPLSIDRTRSFSLAFRNIELLTSTVNYYFEFKLDSIKDNLLIRYIPGSEPASDCKQFWSNIENGIYLSKLAASSFPDEHSRAVTAFQDAGRMVRQALVNEPLDFIRRLFYTLSPTNTAVCPQMRRSLLGLIKEFSSRMFRSSHPLALICGCLMTDDDPEVSRQVLHQLYNSSSDRLGPTHVVTYKLLQSNITILRRSGELESAKNLAETALAFARMNVAHGIESGEARTLARELAQILTKLGEHGQAQELRLEVVESSASEYHEDSISVQTMEDIAEHHDVVLNDPLRSAEWLERAASIATIIWGDTVQTRHITDKLDFLVQRMSKDDAR